MESGRQIEAREASPNLAVELAKIERAARSALAAVEAVVDQAEASRRAVEMVLSDVAELAAMMSDDHAPSVAINTPTLSHGARVLVMQLVAEGASEDEVAGRLREIFGVEDAARLLEETYPGRRGAQ